MTNLGIQQLSLYWTVLKEKLFGNKMLIKNDNVDSLQTDTGHSYVNFQFEGVFHFWKWDTIIVVTIWHVLCKITCVETIQIRFLTAYPTQ